MYKHDKVFSAQAESGGGFMVTSLENNPEELFGFSVLEYRHLDDWT